MKSFLKLFCLIFLLIGCNNQNNQDVEKWIGTFPDPVKLEGTSIFENEHNILYTSFLDTLILCVTDRDTLFHIYDKQENFITSLGGKGRGPGEFAFPPIIQDVKIEDSMIKALVHDQIRMELTTLNITTSIEKNELDIESVFEIPQNLLGMKNVFYLSDNEFVGVYDDRFDQRLDKRRGVFYFGSDRIDTLPLHNLIIEPYDVMPETNLNARAPAISPDRSKMAVALRGSPMIEILDIESASVDSYLSDNNPLQNTIDLKDFNTGEAIEYYTHAFTTDSYIYLLYSGHKANALQADQKIKVIDWNGQPISQYLIPGKYDLIWFIVDEKEGEIYGTSYNNDEVYLFDYSL